MDGLVLFVERTVSKYINTPFEHDSRLISQFTYITVFKKVLLKILVVLFRPLLIDGFFSLTFRNLYTCPTFSVLPFLVVKMVPNSFP